jgi:cyclomaltodextrinase
MKIIRYFTAIFLSVLVVVSCSQKEGDYTGSVRQITPFANVPEWSREVVWYQIFVETFWNGDRGNDPRREDILGSYPGFTPEGWQITPWTQEWYKPDEYFVEMEGLKDLNGWEVKKFEQKTQQRHYGGDLQGVLDRIGYLDSLGITAVYFNPLNDAPSNHKYDARNWRHIDRNFGPDPEKDRRTMALEVPDDPSTWQLTEADKLFLEVVEKLHDLGIRVILDYSWNHVGETFWAWQDVLEKQTESQYRDWYWVDSFDDLETPENEFSYPGWFGVHELIQVKETQFIDHLESSHAFEGDVYSREVKEHIFAVTRKWLDPNGDGDPKDGVDGFRLDVSPELPLGFWRQYRKEVRAVNPEAFLVGETWFAVYPDSMMDPQPFLKGDVFDGVMNYRWYKAAREFFAGGERADVPSTFISKLSRNTYNLREQNNYSMMNVAASHDSPRLHTSLFNGHLKYKFGAHPYSGNDYKIHKPDAKTYQTSRLLLAHQFTYIGAPHIWAGDEMGMWAAEMGDSRKPLIWPDLEFDDETRHPYPGKERPTDEVRFDHDLFDYYRKLIHIRKTNTVLIDGALDFILADDNLRTLAYSRFNDTEEVIVVINADSQDHVVRVPTKHKDKYVDILSASPTTKGSSQELEVKVAARTAAILGRDI